MIEKEILEKKEIRENMVDRIEVLENTKKLLLLGDSEFATTQQVADYYEVEENTLQQLIKRNREELETNGFRLYKKNEILNVLHVQLEKELPNRGMNLFSKRAILNVGMLLEDSKVAKEVRSRLLDVEYESNNSIQDNGQTLKQNIVNEIRTEQDITKELV